MLFKKGRRTGAVIAAVTFGLAAAVYVSAGPATSASAQSAPVAVTEWLSKDTWVASASDAVVLLKRDLVLRAGESRRVVGQVVAFMDPQVHLESIDDTVAVQCVNAPPPANSTGDPVGPNSWTETSLVPGRVDTLRPSLLFTAPRDGAYQCQLLATIQDNAAGQRMKALSGQSYLMVSDGDEAGAHWWQNPDCDSPGTWPTCTYLGDPNGLNVSYLLYNDGTARSTWTAADNATKASATANVELTTCRHTASCGTRRGELTGTQVVSHLEAMQLDAAGRPCNLTKSADQTDFVHYIPHHYSIAYQLSDIPILTTCGSRQFIVRVYLRWTWGNPVKIDGSRPNGTAPQAQTNAFIVNSAYGTTTTTVPNVVGVSQSAAGNALAAANLNVGSVTPTLNTAPAGTVIAQNPPAGTSAALNTPVDLTVSLGGVAVPAVTGLNQNAATAAIQAAGLALAPLSYVSGSPSGTVLAQNPPAGAVIAPGSAVQLTVAAVGVAVPNVLGLTDNAAITALDAVGLAHSITRVQDCSNPGRIVDQGPAGGSVAPSGSTVHLTHDTGTTRTCGFSVR
jgi:beta-lactam-binding protein with PASTA domain